VKQVLVPTRRLIDGFVVKEEKLPVKLDIVSKCPLKWLFVDLETGDVWRKSPRPDDSYVYRRFGKATCRADVSGTIVIKRDTKGGVDAS
jgi:hypothetical protein